MPSFSEPFYPEYYLELRLPNQKRFPSLATADRNKISFWFGFRAYLHLQKPKFSELQGQSAAFSAGAHRRHFAAGNS
jgi:hypothetical protein